MIRAISVALASSLGAACALPLHAADTESATVDAALAQARKTHSPVLIDFHAPWCYSCYFMATHVLNGKEWTALEAKTIVADSDADSPDGAAWMKKLKVKALPAYVVLDEHGEELGRILAEQPRETFYPMIDKIIGAGSTLDGFKKQAAAGSTEALTEVLGAYQARGEGDEGLAWFAGLPPALQTKAATKKPVALLLDRLRMAKATQAKDDAGVIAAARKVLAADVGCERPYVVDALMQAAEKSPPADYKTVLAAQKSALDRLLATRVFIARPTCADARSAVQTTADVDAALGDARSETTLLGRAIDEARKTLGRDLGKDRNLADNLRVYLARAKRNDELDALYPQLIAAYPDDYVYPYRYGRSLVERGKPEQALPLLAQAADKAYGENRLAVATQRVKALRALHREADAEKVVADVLEQNGQWFPDQVAALKASLKS